jgi:hypothetical protein
MVKFRYYKVYWIYTAGMKNMEIEGYIGVTKRNIHYRLEQHFYSTRPVGHILRELGLSNVKVVEVMRGSFEECMEKERELRPTRFIGWNIRAGGNLTTIHCPQCGEYMPKGSRNTEGVCASCSTNDGRFVAGFEPWNRGKGERYLLIDPSGKQYTPEVFTVFCAEQGITPQNLRKVAKGTRKHHKGWKAIRLS